MSLSYSLNAGSGTTNVQTSYSMRIGEAHEGLIADLQPYVARTYINQTGGVLAWGRLLVLDTAGGRADNAAKIIAGATGTVLGVLIDSQVTEKEKDGEDFYGMPDKHDMSVMSKGVIWVYSETAVDPSAAVRVRHTTSTTEPVGRFRATAVAGKTAVLTGGARWVSTTTGAGLALLEIDIPSVTLTADAAQG